MEKTTGYLSRAWKEMTSSEGWFRSVVLMGLANCIPIVGTIFVDGYLVDWGREGAWGMKRGLPTTLGDVGKRGKWGLFNLAIGLAWTLPFAIVGAILSLIPFIGGILKIVANIFEVIAAVIASFAVIYAAVYDNLGAGFKIKRLLNMAKQDASGLARCFLISLLCVVPALIALVILCVVATPLIMVFMGNYSTSVMAATLASVGVFTFILALVLGVIVSIASVGCQALTTRAYGYWLGQFEPAKWGTLDDPMPYEPEYVEGVHGASAPASSVPPSAAASAAAAATAAANVAKEKASEAAEAAAKVASGFAAEPGVAGGDGPIEVDALVTDEAAELQEPAKAAEEAVAEAPSETVGEEATAEEADAEPLEEAAEKCPECGAALAAGQKFCSVCGHKL